MEAYKVEKGAIQSPHYETLDYEMWCGGCAGRGSICGPAANRAGRRGATNQGRSTGGGGADLRGYSHEG